MDTLLLGIAARAGGTLAADLIRGIGRKLAEKLQEPEAKAALQRCCRKGFEALLEKGLGGEPEDVDHVESVLADFFRLPEAQTALKNLLRQKTVDETELVALFLEETEEAPLSQLDAEAGFRAFFAAFEAQVDEEEALREILGLGLKRRSVEAEEHQAAAQERSSRALEKLADAGDAAALEALEAYLRRIRREWQLLPLVVLGGEGGPAEEVTLDQVYIELDTTRRVKLEEEGEDSSQGAPDALGGREETRPLAAFEAAAAEHRLVLLGDPGSGKSTFVQELLARQAAVLLGEGEPAGPLSDGLLPVLIVLRDLSRRLEGLALEDLSGRDREAALSRAVLEQAAEDLGRFGLGRFAGGLARAWEAGRCLLVLDGLDEVPPARRGRVREAVRAVRRGVGPERMIVTCRVRSYHGKAELPGFAAFTLASFDDEKIRRFCEGWYRAQSADARTAEERGEDLARAALAEDLRELAGNPMLLTTLALVHQRNVELPRQRVRLYDEAVKLLLVRWQKHTRRAEGLEDLLADEQRLRRILERVAFEAQRAAGTEREVAGGLARKEIVDVLDSPEYLGSLGRVEEFLDYVDQRAGLLVGHGGGEGRPESYSFPHRTFQEYLVGCHLVGQRDVIREYFTRAGEGDLWSLAAELGGEALLYVRDNLNGLLDLAYGLCGAEEPEDGQAERALVWSGRMAALAGRGAVERDREAPLGGAAYLGRVVARLVRVLESRELAAPERADAGRALAKLGDPREGVMTVAGMELCRVPAGRFWWGGGDDDHTNEETPWEERELAYGYWISRFPVTQAQYAEFADAGGYREERYWVEAREAGVWDSGKVTDIFNGASIDGPEEYGEPFSLGNHPVVGVTWYEALAFTRWLTERLWAEELPKSWKVRLPSEEEWEKAARGGLEAPAGEPGFQTLAALSEDSGKLLGATAGSVENHSPRRKYPWGDEEIYADHANYDDTGIGATSAVGGFPRGRSPSGCEELSGNVWEWCRNLRQGEPADSRARAALRGGSWAGPAQDLAAAIRDWHWLGYRLRNFGFRCVLSSVSEHG